MEFATRIIELNSDRKKINICKKLGIETYNPRGAWNGFGYDKLPMVAKITTSSELRNFNKAIKELDGVKKPQKTLDDKKLAWAKRLAKLSDIEIQQALEIADRKLAAQQDEIDNLNERQYDKHSVKRQKLINKIARSNPLRRIEDKDHANNILTAHRRHSETNYGNLLDEAREMATIGEIDRSDVKDWARAQIKR